MLALAKDITRTDPKHPAESSNSELKKYMDYQRALDTEKLIYHCLEHAATYLQKNIDDCGKNKATLKDYLAKAFPFASGIIRDADNLRLMLRKLIHGHNSTNNWYRMNSFYHAVLYDSMERFIQIHNRLLREKPELAEQYDVSDNQPVDFDDWVLLHFHDLDFMIGKKAPKFLHYSFRKRNQAAWDTIEQAMQKGQTQKGQTLEEAVVQAKTEFDLEDSTVNILLGKDITQKDLELFYTPVDTPIYEEIYSTDTEHGMMDGESFADHSYFMGHQFKGKNEKELASFLDGVSQMGKN